MISAKTTAQKLLLFFFSLFFVISCSNDDSFQEKDNRKVYGDGTSYGIDVDSLYAESADFQDFIKKMHPRSLDYISNWDDSFIYKSTAVKNLSMWRYKGVGSSKKKPTIVFFHGGSWKNGSVNQGKQYAYYFAQKGYTTFSVQYRLFKNSDDVTPYDEVEDAKSAFRYLRKHANELNIDPTKLIGAGVSAGGHLVAGAAYINGYENETENLTISSKPNALILPNAVIDLSEEGWPSGNNYMGENWRTLSPLQNIKNCQNIPSIILSGTADPVVPFVGMKKWDSIYKQKGCVSYLYAFPGRTHGFSEYKSSLSGPNHRDFYYCIYLIQNFLDENHL